MSVRERARVCVSVSVWVSVTVCVLRACSVGGTRGAYTRMEEFLAVRRQKKHAVSLPPGRGASARHASV